MEVGCGGGGGGLGKKFNEKKQEGMGFTPPTQKHEQARDTVFFISEVFRNILT